MRMAALGRLFFAIAIAAFGIQHLIYGRFVTRLVPGLPECIPWHSLWAYLTGAGLLVAAAAIVLRKKGRPAALVLGALILLSAIFLQLPLAIANPRAGSLWTKTGKAVALSGTAFLVAATLDTRHARRDWLVPVGRSFVAAFLILCGIQHFIYVEFVAGLVPSWIPGHRFWTYFTGAALIAGGVGLVVPVTTRVAAALTAGMVFLWVVLLHIPRALANVRDSNETTAVFEALAVTGAALLIGVTARRHR